MTGVRGWVYVITNRAMPGLVKIGYTLKDPILRAKKLDSTGVPHSYVVEYEVLAENPYETEQKIHARLSNALVAKEWYRCSVLVAITEVRAVVGSRVLFERTPAAQDSPPPPEEPSSGHSFAARSATPEVSSAAEPALACPIGTYAGECWYCGDHFSATLTPHDDWVKCPECFRLNDTKKFKRQELYL